jgi:COPII coat assembly protein SEC16
MKRRAAQSSSSSGQSYNYGPASQQSYASPQQKTTHLKSATWNPVSDGYDPYKPNQATTQSSFLPPSTQSAYDPYKPTVTSNPLAKSAYDPYQPQVQLAQSAYDPYQPQVQPAPPVHLTYDSYKPTVQTSSSIQSRSTPVYSTPNNYSGGYSKPPVPPVPLPPRVTAESFRSNTSNAYDPPMLPTKTKRHASGWGSTMTSSTHAPSFPPPTSIISPLAPPPKDSDSTGPPLRTETSFVGPPPRRVDSPAHQSGVKSPGLPPPSSRPPSRQVSRATGVSHLPPPLPSSRQVLPGAPSQSPHQHGYSHQRVNSPGLGTQRNWTTSPEHTTRTSERSPEEPIYQPEQPPIGQDPEVPFNSHDDPEAPAIDADEVPPIDDAPLGLTWDREGGPSPLTAHQSDYVTSKDNIVRDVMVTDMPKLEHPITSPHSRASSYDRLASPQKMTAPPHDLYKTTGSMAQHPSSAIQFAPTSTQVTSSQHDPYKPIVSSTRVSVPVLTPSSPLVNGHGSRPSSLRSSLESTRPQPDYAPPVRSSSPASIRSQPGNYVSSTLKSEYGSSSYNLYAPSNRTRSATNETTSSVTSDTYTPRRQSSEAHDHTLYGSKFGYPDRPSSRTDSLLTSSAYPTYAPSPSLLGTNDPLGRSSARVPVISFGFGGKVVTCFHGADMSSAGFDVALSSRRSREIHIRPLQKLIPQSAFEDTTVVYPGPLFGDSGSPTVSLVRGASTQAKTKKAKVVKYLEDRISELSSVVAYASTGLLEHGKSEGKLVLFNLLKVMVENDGKLNGT